MVCMLALHDTLGHGRKSGSVRTWNFAGSGSDFSLPPGRQRKVAKVPSLLLSKSGRNRGDAKDAAPTGTGRFQRRSDEGVGAQCRS